MKSIEQAPLSDDEMKRLTAKRNAWESLEARLKAVQSLPWEAFTGSIDSAKIPKALNLVQILHEDRFLYPFIQVQSGEKKRIKFPTLFLNNGLLSLSVFYGGVNVKPTKTEDGEETNEIREKEILLPRYITAILDYLHGSIAFHEDNLYLITDKQFILLSELALSKRYKLVGKGNLFNAGELIQILEFIQAHLKLEPMKKIKNAVIACNDFQMDIHNRVIIKDRPPQDNECYFKVIPCDYENVLELSVKILNYHDYVTDDGGSFHNAMLQPIYTMLVISHEINKSKFFISKSGVRTGKGLRQDVISSIFDTKTVLLDNLGSNGFESLNAWSQLDGAEFLKATESGEISGKAMERALKIIATETEHQARLTGGNSGNINLVGVLSIDSNELVLLSTDMNSRAVNIAFKDRPKGESYKAFDEYWQAFTVQTANSTKREATITAGAAALLASFKYWESQGFQLEFKQVEMNNFTADNADFDDAQAYFLEEATKGVKEFIKTGNDELQKLLTETYRGQRKGTRKKKLEEIGLYETQARILTDFGYKTTRLVKIKNYSRFQKAVTAYIESMMD